MTREEAKSYLIAISHILDSMAIEYLTEKDGEKMREAITSLEQEPCEDKRLYIKVFAGLEPDDIAEKIYQICDEDKFPKVIESLKEYFDSEPCNDCISRQTVLNTLFYKSDNNCEVVLNKELQDRIKALPSVTPTSSKMEQVEWIPCSERLPEESGAYLVWMIWGDEEPTYSIINFDADYNEFGEWIEIYDINTLAVLDREFITYIDVFAWMPLPEPYVPEINVGKRAESEDKE